jgi:hypothetical protein
MKKILFLNVIVVLAAALLFYSCSKTENVREEIANSNNRVIPLSSDSKTFEYLFAFTVGHLITDCGGSCITINFKPTHADCMGYGHVCNTAAAVTIQQVGTAITATTTDTFGLTSEDFFLMPARSLNYTDDHHNHIFLNIPAQFLFRDNTTKQFTFTGLFFSNTAAYSNN